MKSKIIILMVFTFFLTSCGKSGDLYLPEEPEQQKENSGQQK
jgi:predicted small lipoprotein YifL